MAAAQGSTYTVEQAWFRRLGRTGLVDGKPRTTTTFGGTRVRGGGMSVDVDHVLGDRPPRGQSNRATLALQRAVWIHGARVEKRSVGHAPEEGAGAAVLRYGAVTNATQSAGAERLAGAGGGTGLGRRGAGRPGPLPHRGRTGGPRGPLFAVRGRHP